MISGLKSRIKIYRMLSVSALGLCIGTIASFSTIGFVELVEWLNQLLLVHSDSRNDIDSVTLHLVTIAILGGGGLLVGLMLRYGVKQKRSLGPADTILSVQLRDEPPDVRSGMVSTFAAILSLGCGASVGQYGPIVYLGTVTGQLARKLNLGISDIRSIVIACGVAAAISTAFNAPIAALIFTHEVILRHYSLRIFTAVTVASACGYIVANVVFKHPPLFLFEYHSGLYTGEFFLFALEGIFCGVIAVLFMKALQKSSEISAAIRIPAPVKPMIAGIVLALVAIPLPEVLGAGQEILRQASEPGSFTALQLWSLLITKLLVTAMCIGFGFAGGIIFPSLVVGILFGAFFAVTVPPFVLDQQIGLSIYAISGMVAVASPVIGAPLTALLIIFEITRNYEVTIAAMVTLVFANLVSYHWYGRSLFDTQLLKRGVDLSYGRDRAYLQHQKISEFDPKLLPILSTEATIKQIHENLDMGEVFVIVDEENQFIGAIETRVLSQLTNGRNIKELIDIDFLTFNEHTSLWLAMEKLRSFETANIPVIHSISGQYLGAISKTKVINNYLDAIHDLRREEHEA